LRANSMKPSNTAKVQRRLLCWDGYWSIQRRLIGVTGPQVESEDLVFTLETIVEKFGEEIAPYAVGLTQNLTAAFWKFMAAEEDEDADEDMGALAAMGSLRAIATIMESVSSLPAERLKLLYPELEALCMPIMVRTPCSASPFCEPFHTR
jgi:hypothetical protein